MRKKYIFKSLIFVILLTGFSFLSKSFSANNSSNCQNNMTEGSRLTFEGPGIFNITTTVRAPFHPSASEQYIQSKIGLLKLEAFEAFLFFIETRIKINEESTLAGDNVYDFADDEGKLNEAMKFGRGIDFSWNKIKRYLALPRVFESCVAKDSQGGYIYVKGSWHSEEIKKINDAIALDDAFIDLLSKFDDKELKKLEKQFPNLFEIEDPNLLIEIIKNKK